MLPFKSRTHVKGEVNLNKSGPSGLAAGATNR